MGRPLFDEALDASSWTTFFEFDAGNGTPVPRIFAYTVTTIFPNYSLLST